MNQQVLYKFNEEGKQDQVLCDLPIFCRWINPKNPHISSYVKKLTRGFITKLSIREPQATVSVYPNSTYPSEEIITEEEFNKEIEVPVSFMKRVLKEVDNETNR